MLHGIYGTAHAMEASAREHEAIAKNLAHAQVPGYRRLQISQGTFHDHVDETRDDLIGRSSTGLRGVDHAYDFTPGAIEQTERPFDVAIDGEGFFVLQDEESPLYTRNGTFLLSADGTLVTNEGRVVEGRGGPIRVPPETPHQEVRINDQGTVTARGVAVGQLRVVSFDDPSQLVSVGTTLFRAPDDVAPTDADTRVVQGFLERSNVHPIQELVDMIASQRRHEAAARSMRTLTRAMERHINES
ncbi:MAG: flagellar basal-body rod protein FlgF [Planctomycetaceae bacterium]|nr:flagellar basal-body rod protein FlgF [Planctomycetaceae bacterium]